MESKWLEEITQLLKMDLDDYHQKQLKLIENKIVFDFLLLEQSEINYLEKLSKSYLQ